MELVLIITAILIALHILLPLSYYVYMRRIATKKPWNIILDEKYEPKVTLIIATYNESNAILKRLENLTKLDYPKEKLEIIGVDSASTDGTVEIAKKYISSIDFPFKIMFLEQEKRMGKAKALNFALKYATGEIIATSDADSYWEPSALRQAIPYLASSQVGALTGREVFLNIDKNALTLAEGAYRDIYNILRVAESKIGSTFIFQGELSLYKRESFDKFEDEQGSDDTGTVINIISKGYRSIYVPNAVFYDVAPSTWLGRMVVKTRRAQHLLFALSKAVKLKFQGKLKLPAITTYMNFYLHAINPILSIGLLVSLVYALWKYALWLSLPLLMIVPFFLLITKLRSFIVSYLTGNMALLLAIVRCIKGDKQIIWKKIER